MKILQVIPSLSPRLGGPTRAAFGFSQSLQNLGLDVQILTTDDDTDSRLDVPLNQLTTYNGVPTTFLPRTLRAKEFIYASSLFHWQQQHLSSFDLVHTHYLFSHLPSFTARSARHKNIPYIMRPLGQLTPWALSQSTSKKKLYASLLERQNLKGASAIHCTSQEETVNVKDFGLQTPAVALPLGVTSPEIIQEAKKKLHHVYGIAEEMPVILFLSRLHPKKQPEVLIKAIGELLRNQPCHVIFAGTGELQYLGELQSLIFTIGIQEHVTFTGFVDGYKKDLLLQGADVFALPSHSENFGIAVAEALISGLPAVITPGIQISTEIDAVGAGMVTDATPEAFAAAIGKVITQPNLQQRLRKSGLQLATSRYSWMAIAKDLAAVYKNIVADHDISQSSRHRTTA